MWPTSCSTPSCKLQTLAREFFEPDFRIQLHGQHRSGKLTLFWRRPATEYGWRTREILISSAGRDPKASACREHATVFSLRAASRKKGELFPIGAVRGELNPESGSKTPAQCWSLHDGDGTRRRPQRTPNSTRSFRSSVLRCTRSPLTKVPCLLPWSTTRRTARLPR